MKEKLHVFCDLVPEVTWPLSARAAPLNRAAPGPDSQGRHPDSTSRGGAASQSSSVRRARRMNKYIGEAIFGKHNLLRMRRPNT